MQKFFSAGIPECRNYQVYLFPGVLIIRCTHFSVLIIRCTYFLIQGISYSTSSGIPLGHFAVERLYIDAPRSLDSWTRLWCFYIDASKLFHIDAPDARLPWPPGPCFICIHVIPRPCEMPYSTQGPVHNRYRGGGGVDSGRPPTNAAVRSYQEGRAPSNAVVRFHPPPTTVVAPPPMRQ